MTKDCKQKISVNPIIRVLFFSTLIRGGGGSKSPDSVKYITGREILCKNENCCYLFYALNAVFGHVKEKSKSMGAQF